MIEIIFSAKPDDPASYEKHVAKSIHAFLQWRFPKSFPENYRIFHKQVAQPCDVTPNNEAEIERLEKLEGPFYVLNMPGTGWEIAAIVVAIIASLAITLLLRPHVPNINQKNQANNPSPNNSLSDRSNQFRTYQRIEDIFGKVLSIPTLVMQPLRRFVHNVEYEESYMCIGRGSYAIDEVKDGDTLVANIPGSSVAIYGPNTSPNFGAVQLQIGDPINRRVRTVKRSNSIDGQELYPPNYKYWQSSANGSFKDPDDFIQYEGGPLLDALTRYFDSNDTIDITSTTYDNGSGVTANLTGQGYTIIAGGVARDAIGFHRPYDINPDWNNLQYFAGGETDHVHTITLDGTQGQHGPRSCVIGLTGLTSLLFNFIAPNGLYEIHSTDGIYSAVDVSIRIIAQPCDKDGNDVGTGVTTTYIFAGSASETRQLARTFELDITTTTGYMKVSCERLTDRDFRDNYQPSDAVVWRDLYAIADNAPDHFGNVTTVQSLTQANSASLAVKDRKLNMLATRKVNQYLGGGAFGGLIASQSADDILAFVSLDNFIGNRTVAELNLDTGPDGIYNCVAAVKAYFGSDPCGQFNYTFDDANTSFEETFQTICQAVFCTGYRIGSQFNIRFEQETNNSRLLFNHRNKRPKSENRTTSFGPLNDNDGVELDWVDPDQDYQTATIFIPDDQSATNPLKVQTTGVTDPLQAYFAASRAYNKIRYQNEVTDFEGLQQAELLVKNDRISVADNVNPDTQDGEVIAQVGLILTLSQPVEFEVGKTYNIFLQHYDASVESIGVTEVVGHTNQVALANAPALTLAIGADLYRPAAFQMVDTVEGEPTPFLVQSKELVDKGVLKVTAINYDPRYYQNDSDFVQGRVDGKGKFTEFGYESGLISTSKIGLGTVTVPEGYRSMMDRFIFF